MTMKALTLSAGFFREKERHRVSLSINPVAFPMPHRGGSCPRG
jgi:hypothetical protein